MSLKTGTNTVRLQVIDETTGNVEALVEWKGLSYEVTINLEEALLNATFALGRSILSSTGK